ncbi:MAG: hypothetical protein KAU02_05310 [Tenericutes bacterium]|nr:hypothetical protein [Mycoplasmatota bacterium]
MGQKIRLAERVVAASKAARVAKASRFGIMISAVLTFMIFAVSYYGEVVGNFTFTVDRMAQNAGITMYESLQEKDYTARLISDKVDNADGMTIYCGTEFTNFDIGDEVCIPSDHHVSSVDGNNNGESYIVYTFYVENAGDVMVDLTTTMNIISTAKNAEEALRVRIIIDGVATTYAKRQSINGTAPGELEPLTESFYSLEAVMLEEITEFDVGNIMKVSVVIWYEGEDADHTINLVGGGVKLDMQFTVSFVYSEGNF